MLYPVISSGNKTESNKKNKLDTMANNSTPSSEKAPVDVTITSDLVCPWCWVGLRKLQNASKVTNIPVKVTWKPFMLRPNTPLEGKPKGGTP